MAKTELQLVKELFGGVAGRECPDCNCVRIVLAGLADDNKDQVLYDLFDTCIFSPIAGKYWICSLQRDKRKGPK